MFLAFFPPFNARFKQKYANFIKIKKNDGT